MIRAAVEVFTDPDEIAYHGHEGRVVIENIEIAPAVVLLNMSRQLQQLSMRLFHEAQARDPEMAQKMAEAAMGSPEGFAGLPAPNRAQRRAAGRRGPR